MSKNKVFEKAYCNSEFLHSCDARTIRILCEYLEPLKRLHEEQIISTVVFFGSSRAKKPVNTKKTSVVKKHTCISDYYDEARELARLITDWARQLGKAGRHLVICTGGGPGLMQAANQGASDVPGGKTIGMNVSLPSKQNPNPYISSNLGFQFHYFFMRKLWLIQKSIANIFFPGGFGTFDELMEVLTLMQTGKIPHRPTVLYGTEFWNEIINIKALARWGVISEKDFELFRFYDDPEDAFQFIKGSLENNPVLTWD